jgi:hypothetical protein
MALSPATSARTYTQRTPHENREAWSIHHPLIGFVRVTTDSGEQGWGQVSTYDADISCEVFHRHVARHAVGTDALGFAATLDLISGRALKFPGPRD